MQKRLACGVKARHDLRHGKENTVTIEELYELIGGNYEEAMGVMCMENSRFLPRSLSQVLVPQPRPAV